jgi:hypothetical protein
MADTAPINIGENNILPLTPIIYTSKIGVADVNEIKADVNEIQADENKKVVTSVDESNKNFVNVIAQKVIDQNRRQGVPSLPLKEVKPTSAISKTSRTARVDEHGITREIKNKFLKELSDIFNKNLNLKKKILLNEKQQTVDHENVKYYTSLNAKLENIIKNIKKIKMENIRYDLNEFVKYDIDESKESKDKILIDKGIRLKYTYRSIFETIMKTLLDNSSKLKISDFQKLIREYKVSTELFYILMNNNKGELITALHGVYNPVQSGGKRKTKNIKINNNKTKKTKKPKKTRSVKKSKKNVTRRR